MTHLGQGTQIKTVQDKEIVLTASNGEHFRMKVADLAEAVRQVMPVATSDKNGLMSATGFMNRGAELDANKILINGIYGGNGMDNTPISDYFTMVVFANGIYVHQLYFPLNSQRIFYRFTNNNGEGWYKWNAISFT